MGVAHSESNSPEQTLIFFLINYYFVNCHIAVFKISISYVKKIDFCLLKQAEVVRC